MEIQLSDHFTYKKLLRFTAPSIAMMIFTSIYGVVDGFFVSNFVGKLTFAAVNFIYPFLMILGVVGFMFGSGGSAIVAVSMGQKKMEKAKRQFSFLIFFSIFLGVVLSVLGILFIRPIASGLGASGELLEQSVTYGRLILIALPALILQYEFQSFFITAGKPQLGFKVTVGAGVVNIVLDALLIGVFRLGLEGAAVATAISQCVGAVIPLIYFGRKNSSSLRIVRPKFYGSVLKRATINGSSELMSNVSISIVSMLYNAQLLKYVGNDGVAAYGVLMYVNLIFLSVFIGYTIGTAPVISYHFGARNEDELKNLLRRSLKIIGVFAFIMFAAAELLANPLGHIFAGYDESLLALTVRGFSIYSFSFLFSGFAIFGSGLFTALNNGLISALISFLRSLVLEVIAVLTIPLVLGVDGIWLSIVFAEFMAMVMTVLFLIAKRNKYHYW